MELREVRHAGTEQLDEDDDIGLEARLEDEELCDLLGGEMKMDYQELVKPRGSQADTGVFKACANVFISFVGAGVLGLPHAFREAGVVSGLLCLILVACLSIYSMMLLVWSRKKLASQNKRAINYGDIGFHALGTMGGTLVDISLVVSQTGFACAYLIFIGVNVKDVFNVADVYTIFACLPFLGCLSLLRHLGQLAPFSIFADCANLIGLSAVYLNDFENLDYEHEHLVKAAVSQIPYFIGVAVYCYEGMGMVLPLEQSMTEREKFPKVLIGTLTLVTLIYATFGIAGYAAFGDHTEDVITLNLPNGWAPQIVKLCLCTALFLTYPVMLFPVSEIIEGHFSCLKETYDVAASGGTKSLQRRRNSTRLAIVAVTGVVAACMPNFGDFIALVGSTICMLLAFILPPFFHMRIFNRELTPLQTVADWLLIAFGFIVGLMGTIDATDSLMNHYGANQE